MTNLKSSSVISLDTNIFINALKIGSPQSESARQLIEQIKEVKAKVSVSILLLEEFFIHVYKARKEKDTPTYLEFINLEGLCSIRNIDQSVAMTAAKLRAKYTSLRTPDAIHLASATESGARVFFTTDKRLPRKIGKLTVKVIDKLLPAV